MTTRIPALFLNPVAGRGRAKRRLPRVLELLEAAGIHVDDISWDELEPFLGRGRMPVLETVKLSDLLDYKRQDMELVAWAQGQDDAFGCDKFVMLTSILRQI